MVKDKDNNVLKFNPQHFSVYQWQRKIMSQINILSLSSSQDLVKEESINNMRFFLNHFSMPINHLILKFDKISLKPKHVDRMYMNFIIDEIYPMYAGQITQLTIENLELDIHNKQEDCQKKAFVESLLLPLKNLDAITIKQDFKGFEIKRGCVLLEILEIIQSNEQFQKVEFLSVLQENSVEEDESFKQKKNIMMNFQIPIIEKISKMNFLKNLQLSLLNMNFNPEFYSNAYKNICKMDNLIQIGLDLWSRNCSFKQQVSYLKHLTSFGEKIKELTFLSDNACKANDAVALKEVLLEFKKLEELSLNGIIFSQKAHFDSFSQFFLSHSDLKKLSLNLIDSDWKKIRICQALNNALENQKQLEEIDITFPALIKFDDEEFKYLQTLILSKSNTLKVLRIQFEEDINLSDFALEVLKSLIQVENLILFHIRINKSKLELNAIKDQVKNVRQIKKFKLRNNKYSYFIPKDATNWEKLSIMVLMQLTNITNLSCNSLIFINLQYPLEDIKNHLQSFKLEKLKIYCSSYLQDSADIDLIYLQKGSLKQLKISHPYEFNSLFPNLMKLTLSEYYSDKQKNKNVLLYMPQLIILNSLDDRYAVQLYESPNYNIANNYYLTTMNNVKINLPDHAILYLRKKKAMIAHLIIYCQLIKPFLSYQADYLHWDLSIDF